MRVALIACGAFILTTFISGAAFWTSYDYFLKRWENPRFPTNLSTFRGVVESHDLLKKEIVIRQESSYPGGTAGPVKMRYTNDTVWAYRTITFADGLAVKFEYGYPERVPSLAPGTFVSIIRDPYSGNRFAAESVVYLRQNSI